MGQITLKGQIRLTASMENKTKASVSLITLIIAAIRDKDKGFFEFLAIDYGVD